MSSLETSTEFLPGQNTTSIRTRVLNLAWPVIGENMLETLLGIVDVALVGVLGPVPSQACCAWPEGD
jgi:Na+-driven multidrug efflux pump